MQQRLVFKCIDTLIATLLSRGAAVVGAALLSDRTSRQHTLEIVVGVLRTVGRH